MNIEPLKKFDLNSLVTLKVLLDEKHVTHAADQLNLTQSAVSRTLAKLRSALNDPILVKSGKHLSLTPKAERMQPALNELLQNLINLLAPEVFDPFTHNGTIRLATTDYGTHTLLPRLVPALSEAAPNLKLTAMDWPSNLLNDLEENKVDLIIGGAKHPPENIFQRVVYHDSFQGVVRKGHPVESGLTLPEYLSLKHIIISPSGKSGSIIDEQLEKLGHQRNVAVRVPHFFAALEIVSKTDHMILLPSHFIRRYVSKDKFSVISAPFECPEIEISMFWHARMHHDPMHQWFRNFVYESIYEKK
jgi:DNA-binding transcriptional LysR family regulator